MRVINKPPTNLIVIKHCQIVLIHFHWTINFQKNFQLNHIEKKNLEMIIEDENVFALGSICSFSLIPFNKMAIFKSRAMIS